MVQTYNKITRQTLQLSQDEKKEISNLIKYADQGEGKVAFRRTVKFSNGFEADINLYDGNNYFTEMVLFDQNGNDLTYSDPKNTFFGDFHIMYDNVQYTVNVK